MARQPKSMRQIKEILRLKHELKLSVRDIARSCAVAASTVGDYLKRAEAAGMGWPIPEEWTEDEILERLLGAAEPTPAVPTAVPDWAQVHEELRRQGVTLRLLWQEYRQAHPTGYGYSRFCELYERWAATLDPALRQVHPPGEKMFVDWAGQTVPIYNSLDGSISPASIFVAVLGASNKTYAEAFPNQKLPSWLTAHSRLQLLRRGGQGHGSRQSENGGDRGLSLRTPAARLVSGNGDTLWHRHNPCPPSQAQRQSQGRGGCLDRIPDDSGGAA